MGYISLTFITLLRNNVYSFAIPFINRNEEQIMCFWEYVEMMDNTDELELSTVEIKFNTISLVLIYYLLRFLFHSLRRLHQDSLHISTLPLHNNHRSNFPVDGAGGIEVAGSVSTVSIRYVTFITILCTFPC
jgi:hypothetical protein